MSVNQGQATPHSAINLIPTRVVKKPKRKKSRKPSAEFRKIRSIEQIDEKAIKKFQKAMKRDDEQRANQQ